MNKSSNFRNCRVGAAVQNILEFQINRDYDYDNNIWYLIDVDYQASDWKITNDISNDDDQKGGSPRMGAKNESFTEKLECTIKDAVDSTYLQEVFHVLTSGDQIKQEFIDHGINVRHTRYLDNGKKVQRTWECCIFTDLDEVLSQLESGDAENAHNLIFNNEPTIIKVGFTGALPKSITDVTADVLAEYATPNLTVTVSNIVDADNLIIATPIENRIMVAVYDEKTGVLEKQLVSDGVSPFIFADLELGDKVIATSYFYLVENDVNYFYRTIDTQKITIS